MRKGVDYRAERGEVSVERSTQIGNRIGHPTSCNMPGWVDGRADDVAGWIGRRGRQRNKKLYCSVVGTDQENRVNVSQ
jgi:hypothetical protein